MNTKALIFASSTLAFILLTFSIPKVQSIYENAGIFFSVNRLYLLLPLSFICCLYLAFKNTNPHKIANVAVFAIVGFAFFLKNYSIQEKISTSVNETVFPVDKNEVLLERTKELYNLAAQHSVEYVICGSVYWNDIFDGYAYYPLTHNNADYPYELKTVIQSGDRRTWRYNDTTVYKNLLLYSIPIDDTLLSTFNHKYITNTRMLIQNKNQRTNAKILELLQLNFARKSF